MHKRVWLLALMAISLAVTNIGPVVAQTAAPSQALQISPPVIDLNADPGQTVTAQIKLTNISGGPLTVSTDTDDFAADPSNESGYPKILLDETEPTRYSLKFWIQKPDSLHLDARESKIVQFQINVPSNAEPGGHYGVIRFTGTPPELEGTGVALSASLGALVLLNVSGDAKESLKVEEFFVSGCKNQGKELAACRRGGWFEAGPFQLTERIKNDGNVHQKPTGKIEIFNIFGIKVTELKFNDTNRAILPDSIRRFEQPVGKILLPGRYRARLTLVYGKDHRQLTSSLAFWVIPWRLIALLLLLAFAAGWLYRRFRNSRRSKF